MKKLLLGLLLLPIASTATAQMAMTISNEEGKFICQVLSTGEYLLFEEGENLPFKLYNCLTTDGYILDLFTETHDAMSIVPVNNEATPFSGFFYASNDCTGQAYVRRDEVKPENQGRLTRSYSRALNFTVERGTPFTNSELVLPKSRLPAEFEAECIPDDFSEPPFGYDMMAAETWDPVERGFISRGDTFAVYLLENPQIKIVRPEVVSCDGFESCPVSR